MAGKVTRTKSAQKAMTDVRSQKQPGSRETLPPNWVRYISHNRTPMALTTTAWAAQGRYIVLYINPSEVQWSLPRRESVTKTAAGAIRNVWPNRYRGTIYDEGTVNFTFQTGNLMPGAGINQAIFGQRNVVEETYAATTEFAPAENATDKEYANFLKQVTPKRYKNVRELELADNVKELIASPPVPPGLSNFYDFLEMINQPMVWSGGENRHVVLYHSRIFPSIRLEGYFTGDAITFPDSSSAANRTTWSATFQIYKSSPKWWKSSELHGAYTDAIRNMGGLSEIFGRDVNPKSLEEAYKNLDNEGQPANPNVSYKQEQTTTTGAATPSLSNKTGDAKTASKPGDTAPVSNEKIVDERIRKLELQMASFVGGGTTDNPYFSEPFAQTDFFLKMLKDISDSAMTKSPPPTQAELNEAVYSYLTTQMTDPNMLVAYGPVIERYRMLLAQ